MTNTYMKRWSMSKIIRETHLQLVQNNSYISLCCTIYIYTFYTKKFVYLNPIPISHPFPFPSPYWQPLVCFLYLWVCFCFIIYIHLFYSLDSAYKWYIFSICLSLTYFTKSSVPAWRIPGMGEPGGLPSMGSHRVGHDWSDLAAAAAAVAVFSSLSKLIANGNISLFFIIE